MNELVITPLGTVSPYCKGDKNCPGYLFEYHDRKILVDCGNGVTRLLNFPEDLKHLSVIITHYHKDHYGDIGAIQYASHVYRKLLSMYGIGVNIYLPDNSINYSNSDIDNKLLYVTKQYIFLLIKNTVKGALLFKIALLFIYSKASVIIL